jgi:ElaB/YqjD/DUF883 family membrane-anchored ribosome-binding protein
MDGKEVTETAETVEEEKVEDGPTSLSPEAIATKGDSEEAESGAETADPDLVKKDEVKGLTAEAQEAVNRRIGKVVAREKTAIERAETAETELEAARSKLEGGLPELVKRLGLHGDLVTKAEAETIDRYGKLRAQRSWCRQHEDGYEGRGEGDPSVDAKTVRQRLVQIEDELDDMGSTAKEIQARVERQAREIWAAGQKALKGKGSSVKGQAAGDKPAPKTVVNPPKIPGGTGTPKAPASTKKARTEFDQAEFKKDGGGKSALEKQFEKLYG